MYGYTGKILRVNLTTRAMTTINTSDYEEWGGGNGMGAAIFWDLVVEPGAWDMMDGFDPRNVVTVMTSPLAGTAAPSAGGRCEVNGIGVYPFPIGWFTRSNFGGRFSGELKAAGWDGIVIEGKASSPCWINIVNDTVTFEDAGPDGDNLWGLDTWETQEEIWRRVTGNARFGEWLAVGDAYTTQRPAVLCIGPAGENLSRIGTLQHGAGSSAGQGGFGGIWGSKNLKAISVQGTGSIEVADPRELVAVRLWLARQHQYNVDNPLRDAAPSMMGLMPGRSTGTAEPNRVTGCQSCFAPCRRRTQSGIINDSQCIDGGAWGGGITNASERNMSGALGQKYGVNGWDGRGVMTYLNNLHEMGVLGLGQAIDSAPLNFDTYGTLGFSREYLKALSFREGIGDDLAEGIARATTKWGRYEEDTDSGLLRHTVWGFAEHDPGGCEWMQGTMVGDRDINEHDFLLPTWTVQATPGLAAELPPEKMVAMVTEKTIPYTGDIFMFDFGEGPTGIYSEHKAKLIAWHRHYTRFYKQSLGYCEWIFCSFINAQNTAGDFEGFTPECETRSFNAVTGKNMTFAEGMKIGQRIWNLQKCIWVLQGRHRDQEKLSPYLFKIKKPWLAAMPVYEDGEWRYDRLPDRVWDEARLEEWKTYFYEVEGWDTTTGWPKRSTLEELGLGFAADKLEAAGKLGT